MLTFGSLKTRIFIFFFSLFLVIQSVTIFLAYQVSRANVIEQVGEQLRIGKSVFLSQLSDRNKYLKINVQGASKDWAFRQAVAQGDSATIESALVSQRNRISADIAMVLDETGKVLARDSSRPRDNKNLSLEVPSKDMLQTHASIQEINGTIYQLVFASIDAPTHIGWLVIGFYIDNKLAQRFNSLTRLDITFAFNNNAEKLIATSVDDLSLIAWLNNSEDIVFKQITPALVKGNTSIIYVAIENISEQKSGNIGVILQQSLDIYLNRFSELWTNLFLLLFAGLALTSILSFFIARSVTEPIRNLLAAISKTIEGEYDNTYETERKDEIGLLAIEFNEMQKAIALREDKIEYRANHDVLTGLFNRNCFIKLTTELIEEDQPVQFALVVIDLNRFKDINDTLGHSIGDQLLAQVGALLTKRFPNTKILARLGGDEFGIVTEINERNSIDALCESIHGIFSDKFQEAGISITLSTSVGISLYPQHAGDAIGLLRMADVAMYLSKTEHRGSTVYDNSLDVHSVQRLALMSELEDAIKNDQLTLYYQPQLKLDHEHLKNSRVTHVECLVRWVHPVHGFMPPDDFIPLAEQTGTICALTEWVVETALKQCRSWRDEGLHLKMAINLSANDLVTSNLIYLVSNALKQNALSAHDIVLEVTESAVMFDVQKSLAQLEQLRDLGVELSIDDFGTGYSSMEQLKKLPVHELKIDKSFVLNIENDEDDLFIVQMTIDLAHRMGLTVVAEGVETLGALKILSDYGCDMIQGYYISRPQAAPDIFALLSDKDSFRELL